VTGLVILYAVMFALYHRDVHGGPGQVIDNAASEAILRIVGDTRVPAAGFGLPSFPKRSVTRPYQTAGEGSLRVTGYFETADGRWCLLFPGTPGTSIWDSFVRAIGREDFLDESQYPPGSEARSKRSAEISDVIVQWFGSHTREEVMKIADEGDITIAPINNIQEAMADPQLTARQAFIEVEDDDFGPIQMVAPTPRFGATPGVVARTGPRLGEHSEEIYRGLLGLSPEKLDQLRREGII
jgi:crotonobetainyl-CoA:carnitine CoA-transferase CaiB-like acyl-CoA transferase